MWLEKTEGAGSNVSIKVDDLCRWINTKRDNCIQQDGFATNADYGSRDHTD